MFVFNLYFFLHSIVSFGPGDDYKQCIGSQPNVYTRISTHIPWIENAMEKWNISEAILEPFMNAFIYLKYFFIVIVLFQIIVVIGVLKLLFI